jgi:DNA invertase Pin-like site-specific DNA recombinase
MDDFRRRYRGEFVPAIGDGEYPERLPLGATYVRYSDEDSNPRSLDQQLLLVLERARRDGVFVPWRFVYGDAGWTATVVARTGYLAFKAALAAEARIGTLYVDEVDRASRYSLETLRFDSELVERLNRRLVGISDGHDSSQPQARMMLHVRAMMAENFIAGLKTKVGRGQRDGFERDEIMERPAFGYRLEPLQTADGRPVLRRGGLPKHKLVIDEAASAVVREVFRLYVEDGRSPDAIAKWLNGIRAGRRAAWQGGTVRDMLDRHIYVGIRIRGMERHRIDPETGCVKTERRPVSEWKIRRRRDLQIVPRSVWKAARRLRQDRAGLFPRGGAGRAEAYPATLLRPVCGSCGAGLILGRGGKYASWFCHNSRTGAHGCRHKGYKAVGVLERAVLGAVRDRLFGEGFVEHVLADANASLAELAGAPRTDLEPLRRSVAEAQASRDLLAERLAKFGEEGLDAVVERLKAAEARLKDLRKRLLEAIAASAPPPEPLTRDGVESLLADLRGLLGGDKEAAAPVLRDLIGTVVIRQEHESGSKKPVWYAEFALDLAKVAVRLGGKGGCPQRETWEFLKSRSWTMSDSAVRVRAEHVRVCEKLASKAAALAAEGLTTGAIASRLGTDWATADAALAFSRTGERKPVRPAKAHKARKRGRPRPGGIGDEAPFRKHAAEAVRLRDGEGLTWKEIGRRLGVCDDTTRRAYRHGMSEAGIKRAG